MTEKKQIISPNAPKAIGPYSQAIKCGNLLFLSGQIAVDPEKGKLISGDAKAHVNQIMKNISSVLSEAGLNLSDIVKTTIFLKNMDDFALVNETYAGFFSQPYPARSTVAVAKLPLDTLVEIEVIAVI